ncbi:hypothetical protein [Rothia sp. P5766]
MAQLTESQLETKVIVLEQENARLRSAVLDYQIRAGEILLAPDEGDK